MKYVVFIFLIPASLYAEGPLFRAKDTFIQQEYENVYQDIRGVKSKLAALLVNVKDYGAKGDGVADDSAAVDAACTAVGKGVLFFPHGSYKLSVNISTRACSIQGEDLGTKFLSVSTSAFMLSFYGTGIVAGNGARRFVKGVYFQGSNAFTDRAVYLNSIGFLSFQNCRYNDLEYGVYKNSTEWINYDDTTFNGCKHGTYSSTKNTDILGNGPIFNQNSNEDHFFKCTFISNTVGYYSSNTDNTRGDSTHYSSFIGCTFVSNSLAAAGGDAGNVGYGPMFFSNCYFEDNNPGGTTTVDGIALPNGNITFNGGSLSIDHGFFLNGPITITGQSYVTGNDVRMNEGSIVTSTTPLSYFSINNLVGDRNGGMSTEALVPTGLAPYSNRAAMAVIPPRGAFVYGLGTSSGVARNSIGQSTLGLKGSTPVPYISTPTVSFFTGDGLYANTCIKITGATGNGVYWQGTVSSSSYYVTTFAVRQDSNTVGSMQIQMTNGDNAVTASPILRLSNSWKTYGAVGFSNTSGENPIIFQLLQNGTFYVDTIQQVDFPSLQEAIAFYDSNIYVLKSEEVSNREYAASAVPTVGLWNAGDLAWNNFNSTNTNVGWVCTSSGTPGTWQTFGFIGTASSSGSVTSISSGYGLTGGPITTTGTLSLLPNVTSYIQNGSSLQSSAVFSVSSASVQGQFTAYQVNLSTLQINTNVVQAASGGFQTFTIPNVGAPANFLMSAGSQTDASTTTHNGTQNLNAIAGNPIHGTNTNDNAAMGFVGEYISSSPAGTFNAPGSNTWFNVGSIVVSSGDWDVEGMVEQSLSGATVTKSAGALSLFSGATTTDLVNGVNVNVSLVTFGANDIFCHAIPRFRVSVTVSTTVYLKADFNYSAGTPTNAGGTISARRVR